jgi:PKD repeat protein
MHTVNCVNSPVFFTDQSNCDNCEIISWHWDFGDGSFSTEQNPSHTYQVANIYNVKLTVTSDNQNVECSTDEFLTQVKVYSYPIVDFVFDSVCYGFTTTFTDKSTNQVGEMVSWNWDFGDGSFSSEQNPLYQYEEEDTFNVKLTVTVEGAGCENFIEKDNIIVNQLPSFGFSQVSTMICPNTQNVEYGVKLLNLPENGATFNWDSDQAVISDPTTNPVFVNWKKDVQGTGNLYVTVTNKITKCDSTISLPIVFADTIAPDPEEINVKQIVNGDPIVLIYPEHGYHYQWFENDNKMVTEVLQYLYPIRSESVYKVYVEPIDTFEEYVCGNYSAPFSYSKLKYYSFSAKDAFIIFPNPAVNEINIIVNEEVAGTNYENTQLRIINSTGDVLLVKEITSWETTIPVNGLQSGLYFVEVSNNGRNKQVKKIVIQ